MIKAILLSLIVLLPFAAYTTSEDGVRISKRTSGFSAFEQALDSTYPISERQHRVRIAIVGLCPDLEDKRLSQTDSFKLVRKGKCQRVSPADTELCVWLKNSWPQVSIFACDSLGASHPSSAVQSFAADIEFALQELPQVILFRESILKQLNIGSVSVLEQIAKCLENQCLPVVITQQKKHSDLIFPGVLHLQVLSEQDCARSSANLNHTDWEDSIPFGIREQELITECFSTEHAAMAYATISLAAMNISTPWAHLERASRVYRMGKVIRIPNEKNGFSNVRTFVPWPKSEDVAVIEYWGLDANIDQTLGDKYVYRHYGNLEKPEDPERSIKILISNNTLWRHLDALSRLTCTKPELIQSLEDFGLGIVRLMNSVDTKSIDGIVSLWKAHSRVKDEDSLVFRVNRNQIFRSKDVGFISD